MSASNPINWFEIPVTDIARAKAFYESILDTELAPPMDKFGAQMCFFPMEMDKSGATGALMQSEVTKPSHDGTRVYFSVPAIDPTLEKINNAGGKTCMPRTSIGEHGFIAHFEDTEGNCVALHEAPQQ